MLYNLLIQFFPVLSFLVQDVGCRYPIPPAKQAVFGVKGDAWDSLFFLPPPWTVYHRLSPQSDKLHQHQQKLTGEICYYIHH